MTALHEASAGTRGDTADAPPDALVAELRDRLPDLVDEALADPSVATELGRRVAEADRAGVRAHVRSAVLRGSQGILRHTNPEIAGLRLARQALADHEQRDATPAARTPSARDRKGHALTGAAMWPGLVFPLATWQLGQTSLSGGARFWIFVAGAVAGGFALRWAHRLIARAGTRFTGKPARAGAGWPVTTAIATTFLLVLWRLWPSSKAAMGPFWATVVWVLAGLAAGFVFLTACLATFSPEKDEEPGRRIPPPVVARTTLTAAVAAVAAYLLLSHVIPLPWPDWQVWLLADGVTLLVLVLGGPLSLSPGLVPARLSQDPERRGSAKWTATRDALRVRAGQAERDWRSAAMRAVLPAVTRHLNEAVNPSFSTVLPELNRAGLGLMRAGDRIVDTAAFTRLRRLTSGISGGAIGVAGPRGAGKSTLLEAYQAGRFLEAGRQHIVVLESVPVRYDAREFVLHLFARTCAEVLGFCAARIKDRPPRWTERLALLRPAAPLLAAVVLWVVVGFVGAAAVSGPRQDFGSWLSAMWWPLVVVLAGVTVLYLARRRRFARAPAPALTRRPRDLPGLRDLARETLDGIEFQQKHTSGWSGKVGLLFGAETGLSDSRELTRQPRSYPQIVHEFGEFLRTTIDCVSRLPDIATPSVVIVLDELDKILSPEEAQDFVNEVKALFNLDVPGFLFLVSVSEDALASFERRGLPVRDAFDSAFDMIFRLDHLRLPDAGAVLGARVLGLPEPFVCLCHCLAGGLPRELIRVARLVTAEPGSLDAVCRRVVDEDLKGKLAGLRTVVAREAYDHARASELVRHVEAHAVPDAPVLLTAAARPPVSPGDDEGLRRVQLETLGYLYYLGTIREVFGDGFGEAELARGRDSEGDASFDTLTSVRQLFAVNARLAWLTVSAFREAWGLDAVAPPEAG
ncbi:hypothetical protein [Amycolatopsis thermoflava]|uniref:hypothetical protein n=1 Tax=Amycolatopsis thermoflava TaxID=84480 RepID=UPI0003F9A505|nr:hypothetical protein [Amycolatopsis thermoflava]